MVRAILKVLCWLSAIVILLSMPISVLPRLRWACHIAMPDIFIIACICIGILKGSVHGSLFGLVLGLLQGISAGAYCSQHAVSRLLAGFVAGWLKENLLHEHWLAPLLCAICGASACEAAMLITAPQILISFGEFDPSALGTAAIEIVYTAVIVPLVIAALKSVAGRSGSAGRQVKVM